MAGPEYGHDGNLNKKSWKKQYYTLKKEPSETISSNALRTVPPECRIIFAQIMTMKEKQILARAIGIQKGNWDKPFICQT